MDQQIEQATLRTCVTPYGRFIYGLHQPIYRVVNMRGAGRPAPLGKTADEQLVMNEVNFPLNDIDIDASQAVFEIPNPLPFRGTTYIGKEWADRSAADPKRILLKHPEPGSLHRSLSKALQTQPEKHQMIRDIIENLPQTMKLALAVTSNDPEDLISLAQGACSFHTDPVTGLPLGMQFYIDNSGNYKPKINNQRLFELVANNRFLPDEYKRAMVLKPGIQGKSEIVGDQQSENSHIYEYLRGNSYIAWGHYAANMAEDAVRYDVGDLTWEDIQGLRHLYYQRTYIRLATLLKLTLPRTRGGLSDSELEKLRFEISKKIKAGHSLQFTATLWGWNYGFDYAPGGYRLHASHQQIHQQYALIPDCVSVKGATEDLSAKAEMPSYACGDMIQDFVAGYRRSNGCGFFDCYQQAIRQNKRMDSERNRPDGLEIMMDDHAMLFVPKAQTSQWELQIMTLPKVGNILETDADMRRSLDRMIWQAMRILRSMGAKMITVIEFSKRFTAKDDDQRLVYAFLPRLPESPGAFSEAQLRWINGHYPEDFAHVCRSHIDNRNGIVYPSSLL